MIRENMVLTVKPPVFVGSEFMGARIIDNVLVTADEPELLSQGRRDLIVVD